MKLDASKDSKASILLWVLAKRLRFIGVDEPKGLVAGKVRKKSLAATTRPISANDLRGFFSLEQVQNEWKVWRDRLSKLGKVFQTGLELNGLLLTFLRDEIKRRDACHCFICAKHLSPLTTNLRHIFGVRGSSLMCLQI